MKFSMKLGHTALTCMYRPTTCKSTVTNMSMVQIFDVISDKFNVDKIRT